MDDKKKNNILSSNEVYRLIQSFTGQSYILTIPRVFIDYTGDLPSALLLSQLLYWSERSTKKDGYVWKTYKDWEEELSLNSYQVKKAANKLKDKGFLKTAVRKAYGNPTVHYFLIKDEFLKSFMEFLNKRKLKIQNMETTKSEQTNNMDSLQKLNTDITNEKAASCFAVSGDSLINKIVAFYFQAYQAKYGQPHPNLKKPQMERVCSQLMAFAEESGCDLDNFCTIIHAHFNRKNGLVTDGNINHFATEGILKNLFYKHCI